MGQHAQVYASSCQSSQSALQGVSNMKAIVIEAFMLSPPASPTPAALAVGPLTRCK